MFKGLKFRSGRFVLGASVAAVVGLIGAGRAEAVVIIQSALAPATSQLGTGASGQFWDSASALSGLGTDVNNLILTTPNSTWTGSILDYPQGANTVSANTGTLDGFLGADAATRAGDNPTGLNSTVYRISGLINITADMDQDTNDSDIDVTFQVGGATGTAADSMQLIVGDTFLGVGGTAGFNDDEIVAVAEFATTGLFSFELLSVKASSGAVVGLTLSANGAFLTTNVTVAEATFGRLFNALPGGGGGVVPAPAALPAGLALLGMMGLRRKRRGA